MSDTENVRSAGSPWSRTTWWLLGVLVVVSVVAVARLVTSRPPDPLHGDSDDATGALEQVLARTPAAARKPLLLKYVQDSSPGLRYAAVDALGSESGPDAAAAIEHAFLDSSSMVRQRAMEVLPNVDRDAGLRMLLAGLRDDDRWVRESAATQLRMQAGRPHSFVDRRAVPSLIRALDDPSNVVVVMSVATLRKVTGQDWPLKSRVPEAERQAVLARWRQWWQQTRARWAIPAAFADVPPVYPTRTDPAPDIPLQTIDGARIDVRGKPGAVTLLNFWGTWCPTCQQEVPGLVRLDREYRARGVRVVGIAVAEDGGADGLRKWCRAHGVTYPQVLATQDVQSAYGHIQEVPVSVLIDRQGRIRYRWDGDRDYATFRAAVDRLLAEKS